MFPHIHIKNQISAICVLMLIALLTFGSFANADSFRIRDGETRTTTQILSDDETGTIDKGGAIKTTNNGENGVEGGEDNIRVNNFGSIVTMGNDADGISLSSDDDADDNEINNYGTIKTFGDSSHGISFVNDDDAGEGNVLSNFGSITTMGMGSHGIIFDQEDGDDEHTVNNHGFITTKGDDSDGINFRGDDNTDNSINNYGSINTKGNNSHGMNINDTSESVINNFKYGSIATSGNQSFGIVLDGGSQRNIINNNGSVSTREGPGIAIQGSSINNTINNFKYGTITVEGVDNTAIAIVNDSGNNMVNNYGGIFATKLADQAFFTDSAFITLNLFPTSRMVGRIRFLGAPNEINLIPDGAGVSSTLMFEGASVVNAPGRNMMNKGGLTGTYFVVDPSGQSISGAALGTLTEGIHNVVGNRSRFNRNGNPAQLASTRFEPGMMQQTNKPEAWFSGIGSHRQRADDGQVLAYDHDYYGGVGGYEMSLGKLRVGALAGYVRSDIATDFTSIQTDTDSFFAGVYGQMKLFGWLYLDADFLFGYEDHSNDRLVVDNINGFETAEADFDSFFISPSFTLSVPLKVNNKTEVRPSGSLNYAASWHDSYTESGTTQSNLNVDSRTVQALIGKIQMAVFHQFSDNWAFETRIGGRSRHTFSDFNANLAGSTFETTTYGDDHVFGGYFGANVLYAATDRLNVTLDAEYSMTEGDETNIASQLGVEFTF